MATIAELRRSIERDAAAYDRAVTAYNELVKKEKRAGNIKSSGQNITLSKTAAGKAAGKRLVDAYNAVARRGAKLKAEMLAYNQKATGKTATKRTAKKATSNRRKARR